MTTLRPTPPPTGRRPELRRPGAVLAILFGYPALLGIAGVALIAAWAPSLPDPVAVQWDGAEVSGTMPLSGAIALTLAMVLGDGALFGAIGLQAIRSGQSMGAVRGIAALGAAITTFLGLLVPAILGLQLGLADARAADGGAVGVLGAAALGAAALAGALAAALLPRQPEPELLAAVDDAPALELGGGERAAWLGRTRPHSGMLVALSAPFLLCALLPLLLDGPALLALLPSAVAGAVLALAFWRVRVDARGVAVLPALGWPGWRIPLGAIAEARAVDVNALGEFGGFGVRIGRGGRWGLVLRSGAALELRRHGKRPFVVTVDGAEEAAALLNGFRRRDA